MSRFTHSRPFAGAALLCALLAAPLHAQILDPSSTRDERATLVAAAESVNPALREQRARLNAARLRIGPASALPDPMLGVGVMNLPIREPGFGSEMAMAAVMLGQMVRHPEKRAWMRRAAEHEAAAAEARLEATRVRVRAAVLRAYHELAYVARAAAILDRSRGSLDVLGSTAASRYAAGSGTQAEVLSAQLAASRLVEEMLALEQMRATALARLNALLDRVADAPIDARLPERVAPLPPLDALIRRALRSNPELREHERMIDAQRAELELARKAHLPDFDVSIQYGVRPSHADVVSVMVSAPLPLRRGTRQAPRVAAGEAGIAALEAEHHAQVNELRTELANARAEAERARRQIELYSRAVLPQARAAEESARAGLRTGRADLATVLERQLDLNELEIGYARLLADYASAVAELERLLGEEVLP